MMPITVSILNLCCAILSGSLAPLPTAAHPSQELPIPFAFCEGPTNCETKAVKFDSYAKDLKASKKDPDQVLIAVSRLGSKEYSTTLNQSRLYVVRAALIEDLGLSEEEVVTAVGSKVIGYGRVEIFIGGKLVDVLLVNRGKGLCADCCYPEGKTYSYPDQSNSLKQKTPRNLRLYEKAAPYTFEEGIEPGIRLTKDAKIREFLWSHWRKHKRGYLTLIRYNREGEPNTFSYFIEPDERGEWRIAVRIDRIFLGRGGSKYRQQESTEYSAYAVERLESYKGGPGQKRVIVEEERPSPSYRLALKDKTGKLLTVL